MTSTQRAFKHRLTGMSMLLAVMVFVMAGFMTLKAVAAPSDGEVKTEETAAPAPYQDPGVVKSAFLAAAIAVGVGSIGAGAAVGYVGAAAMGAVGEKPELAGRALIFVGLAEGIAIYGLIIAIMLLGKV